MFALSSLLMAVMALQGNSGADFAARAAELQIEAERQHQAAISTPAATRTETTDTRAFNGRLIAFADQALALSFAIEERNGPEDLRCIYRGMATNALDQRDALANAALQVDAISSLQTLIYLFEHASQIGPIADQAEIEPFIGVDPSCSRGPLNRN